MTTALLYPDAVLVTTGLLRSALVAAGQTVHVGSLVPNPRPATFVKVTRTGGPKVLRVVDGAQITVDCWAADGAAAMNLAQLCRKCIEEMPGTAPVHRIEEIGGPQDLPDPVSNTPRVTFTVQVQMRGQAA
jgi:hypothetical protein